MKITYQSFYAGAYVAVTFFLMAGSLNRVSAEMRLVEPVSRKVIDTIRMADFDSVPFCVEGRNPAMTGDLSWAPVSAAFNYFFHYQCHSLSKETPLMQGYCWTIEPRCSDTGFLVVTADSDSLLIPLYIASTQIERSRYSGDFVGDLENWLDDSTIVLGTTISSEEGLVYGDVCAYRVLVSLIVESGVRPEYVIYSGGVERQPDTPFVECFNNGHDMIKIKFFSMPDSGFFDLAITVTNIKSNRSSSDTVKAFSFNRRSTGITAGQKRHVSGELPHQEVSAASSGCGNGFGLALLPLLYVKGRQLVRRRKHPHAKTE